MKRFFEADIWKERWFQELKPEYKAFWYYINAHCDTAGVWDVNLPLAAFQIGCKLDECKLLEAFGKHLYQISECKWLITGFIRDQQNNKLKSSHNAQKKAVEIILQLGIADKYLEPITLTYEDDEGEIVTNTFQPIRDVESRGRLGQVLIKSSPALQVKGEEGVKVKITTETDRSHPAIEEVVSFCSEIGLSVNDGEYIFLNWEENDWKNTKTKRPIKNWRTTVKKWKAAGHFPSQKKGDVRRKSIQERISYDEEF